MDYRVEVITPAGRKRYLEILYKYLKSQKDCFDTWQLWLNTNEREDIEYMRSLESENSWIKCYICPVPFNGTNTIYAFFGDNTKRDDTIYIRLDDDIVYLEGGFISKLKALRLKYREPFFIYPNIINNAIISHLHYRAGNVTYPRHFGYGVLDSVGWNNGEAAEAVHKNFLRDVQSGDLTNWHRSFNTWKLYDFERVSINSLAFFGSDMKLVEKIKMDEEVHISVEIPRQFNRPNLIVSSPLCAHFAFYTQRPHLERQGGLVLAQYKALAEQLGE